MGDTPPPDQPQYFAAMLRMPFRSFCAADFPRGYLVALLLSLTLPLASCAVNPVSGKQDLVFMSEDREIELGKLLHPKILERYGGEYDDPAITSYVEKIGNRLAEESHRPHLIYHFTVLDTPQINAFALPGGYIYITRGIMAYMESEAELAGVIGHEIGHVTARHGVKQHTKGVLASVLAVFATNATNSPYADDLVNMLSVAIIRGYGRKHELEADRLGAEYTARSGRDPRGMLDILETLKDQEEFEIQLAEEQNRKPNVYHGLFSTHPKNDDRLQEVIGAAASLEDVEILPEDKEVFLRRLEGMTFGLQEREGVVRGNHFYHRDLGITFSFPQEWLISNQPSYILARNTSDTSMMIFTVEDRNLKRQTPRQFLEKKLKGELSRPEPLSTARFKGYTTLANFETPYGVRQGRVAVFFSGKKAYLFHVASRTEEEFERTSPLFMGSISSLRPLNKSDSDALKPLAISLIRTKPQDTFASLTKESAFSHHAEEQLRLLNGMYPRGEPKPGQLIKIVR